MPKKMDHTSANFSGIAKEIVAKGEELDAQTPILTSHKGRPIFTLNDFEAKKYQSGLKRYRSFMEIFII